MKRVLIIIPAYNEQDSLKHTVSELIATTGSLSNRWHIDYLIVNDGSTDDTRRICIQNRYPFLDLPVNVGLTAGFQAGMKYANRKGYDYAIQFDADGQHDPSSVEAIIDAAETQSADIVIGSRFVNRKKNVSMRMLGSAFITGMIRITSGKRISDPTSGMRLFSRNMIKAFATDSNYAPEPDTLAYAMRTGAKVVEVPVIMRERFAGKSYLTAAKSIIYMMRMGVSILFFQWVRKEQ